MEGRKTGTVQFNLVHSYKKNTMQTEMKSRLHQVARRLIKWHTHTWKHTLNSCCFHSTEFRCLPDTVHLTDVNKADWRENWTEGETRDNGGERTWTVYRRTSACKQISELPGCKVAVTKLWRGSSRTRRGHVTPLDDSELYILYM